MAAYGYVRVSSADQNEERQLIVMHTLGIPPACIYTDKQSGKDTARPQLQRLMRRLTRGDTLVVESVSRFARNTRDLLDLVEALAKKGVEFVSQKESIDTTTPTGKFMLTVFGAVAELEREYILQRQAEGIVAAKQRGVHLGRPPRVLPANFANIVQRWENKEIPLATVLTQCEGICPATFYRRLALHRQTRQQAPKRCAF